MTRLAKFISMMLLISILSILAVAEDQPRYLVVVASARSAAEIAEKARKLAARIKRWTGGADE